MALTEGDAHDVGDHLAGSHRGPRPVRGRGARPPAVAPLRPHQPVVPGRAARRRRTGGVDVRRWSRRRRAAGASEAGRRAGDLAGRRRRGVRRRPIGDVPDVRQPMARRRTPPDPGADPGRGSVRRAGRRGHALPRPRSTPATATESCRRSPRTDTSRNPSDRTPSIAAPTSSRRYFSRCFSAGGGIGLERCCVTDDGVRCALEYNCVRWGSQPLPAQAGLAVFERDAGGLLDGGAVLRRRRSARRPLEVDRAGRVGSSST